MVPASIKNLDLNLVLGSYAYSGYCRNCNQPFLQKSQGNKQYQFLLYSAEALLFKGSYIVFILGMLRHELFIKFYYSCTYQVAERKLVEIFGGNLIVFSQIAGYKLILFRKVGMMNFFPLLVLELGAGVFNGSQGRNSVVVYAGCAAERNVYGYMFNIAAEAFFIGFLPGGIFNIFAYKALNEEYIGILDQQALGYLHVFLMRFISKGIFRQSNNRTWLNRELGQYHRHLGCCTLLGRIGSGVFAVLYQAFYPRKLFWRQLCTIFLAIIINYMPGIIDDLNVAVIIRTYDIKALLLSYDIDMPNILEDIRKHI